MALNVQTNRHLREFSTFAIGGPIRYFIEVFNLEMMKEAFSLIREKELPFFVLGKGSNCLFPDEGFPGAVLLNKIDTFELAGESLRVGAGYSFSYLGAKISKKGLSGLEFASGIPATVGGSIFMNAGANQKETADSLYSVEYLHLDGKLELFKKENLSFSYRSSPFQKMKGAIVFATFQLEQKEGAREKQLEIIEKRIRTQPLKDKSAGCIFRNPASDQTAGALIDQAGLKGACIGGAKVSDIHANFIVNKEDAKAKDVLCLINHIQKEVYEKTGVFLEPEVKIFS